MYMTLTVWIVLQGNQSSSPPREFLSCLVAPSSRVFLSCRVAPNWGETFSQSSEGNFQRGGGGVGEYKWGFPLSLCCVQRKLRAIYHHPERVPFTNSPFTSHEGEKSVNTRGDSFAAALASCSLFPSLCFLTSRAVWPPRSSWQNYHSACAAVQQKL